MNFDDYENELLTGLKTMNALIMLSYNTNNRNELITHFNIHKIVSPIIHINCSCILHSNLNISLYNPEII